MQKPFLHIVYYIYYDELQTLGPYLYAIKMWSQRGHSVTVYSLTDEKHYRDLPDQFRCHFQHYSVKFPTWLQICCLGLQGVGFIMRKIFCLQTKSGEWAKLLKMIYFAIVCSCKSDRGNNQVLIGTDPPGLWTATLVSKRYGYPYIYFVKEMFLSGDTQNVFDRAAKYLEKKANKKALYTVEFDETRAEMLRRDNGLAPDSMLWVPNAPAGAPNLERGRYFRDKFGIKGDKKIVLYTGGIADYNLTYEHIDSVVAWPECTVLVMHLKGMPRDLDALRKRAEKSKRDVYFSTDLVPFDEIDKVYSSCDIGLALYGNHTLNHKYSGLSSGKMFNFIKACVPVITNATPSCITAVEKTGCGICIKEINEIGNAIQKILENEESFRRNCFKTFPMFSYDKNHEKLMNAIEKVIPPSSNP